MSLWYDVIREVLARLRGGDYSTLGNAHIHRRRTVESVGGSAHRVAAAAARVCVSEGNAQRTAD